jgi:hypothetical protein
VRDLTSSGVDLVPALYAGFPFRGRALPNCVLGQYYNEAIAETDKSLDFSTCEYMLHSSMGIKTS